MVTTGLGALADVDMGMEIAVGIGLEPGAGWGNSGGRCLLAFDTLVTLGLTLWRVYWMPPWITVGVDEVKIVPVAMVITGWGLKMKLLCC